MKTLLTFLSRAALALMTASIVLYLADWAVFAVRSRGRNGYDTVQVEQYLSTPLKGDKNELDFLGTVEVPCAKALFPHGGAAPCWWQRRHTQEWE